MTNLLLSLGALGLSLILSLLGLPVMWIGSRIGHITFVRSNDAMHRLVSAVSLGLIALVSAAEGFSELL